MRAGGRRGLLDLSASSTESAAVAGRAWQRWADLSVRHPAPQPYELLPERSKAERGVPPFARFSVEGRPAPWTPGCERYQAQSLIGAYLSALDELKSAARTHRYGWPAAVAPRARTHRTSLSSSTRTFTSDQHIRGRTGPVRPGRARPGRARPAARRRMRRSRRACRSATPGAPCRWRSTAPCPARRGPAPRAEPDASAAELSQSWRLGPVCLVAVTAAM